MVAIAQPAVDATTNDIGAQPAPVSGRWIALAILTFVYMLNFMDRQILSVVIEPIKREIAINDTEIGLLTGTLFAIIYSFITVPIALLADRTNRLKIVAAGCMLWSIFTGLSGFATSFLHLALARIGVAFGEGGGVAPSLSILSDLFPPKRRVIAVSLFTSASPLGVLVGTMAGGYIAAVHGWRWTFYAAGIVGIITVPILLLLVREPKRGTFEVTKRSSEKPTTFLETISLFGRLPSLKWLAISAGLFAAIGNGLLTWMPALLMRGFGMEVKQVALYYGPLVGLGLAVGTWGSGAVVGWLGPKSIRSFALVPATAMVLCAPFFAFAMMSDDWQTTLVLLALPIALVNAAIAPTLTLVQDLAPPDARSTASALLMMVLNFVGIGLGPLIVGIASDWLQPTMGSESLRYALVFSLVPTMLVCAGAFLMVARHLPHDHGRVVRGEIH